jgi:collagenase-like PrtC family protease
MEMTVRGGNGEITLGPVWFNWKPNMWRDFYFHIADEAPVGTVYIGEAICSKRAPFFEPYFGEVVERLKMGGKMVVLSTLAEVILKHDRKLVESICTHGEALVEANDASALWHLAGRAHHVGPFFNIYNEDALAVVARKGAINVCLPVEMPKDAIRALGAAAAGWNVSLEVQVFGRMPLALSARCYHARAHGRTKDSCQYVCENDPDGLALATLEGKPFLAINGIQTLSHDYLNLVGALPELRRSGVSRFRLSPHSCDMVAVAKVFRDVLDRRIGADEALGRLDGLNLPAPFSNGFFHHKPGCSWTTA